MITPSDVRWAYKYYLGREPDDQAALEYHQGTYDRDRTRMRAAFYNSEEATSQPWLAPPPGQWCLWRPGKPRLVVAGPDLDSQGAGLGTGLARAAAAMAEISAYGVDLPAANGDELATLLQEADFILFPPLGEEFGPLHAARLRERHGPKLAFYQPPRFGGLHPDLVRLAGLASALDETHSRLALQAFAAGQSAEACLAGYEGGLAALDPRARFRAEEAAFHAREAGLEVRVGRWFFRALRRQPLLRTADSPTPAVLIELAAGALRHFGVRHAAPHPALLQDALAGGTIWPVHPSVARALRLAYAGTPLFSRGNQAMSLGEFTWRCYEVYARTGLDAARALAAA